MMNARKRFLFGAVTALNAVALALCVAGSGTASAADAPATHNMLIVGTETVYLSHLPMFQPMLQEEEQPRMPHRYQAILEVTIGKQNGYVRDRREHASTRIYTLTPEDFVLPELVSSDPQGKPRRSFKADEIFRGHLERDDGIPILQNVNVSVKNVIYFREFDPKDKKSPQLEYLLFGKGPELFMAHVITAAPDFDQVMAVKVTGHKFTNAELARGVRVVFPDKTNAVASRLREKQRVAGEIKIDQAAVPKRIQVEVTREFYFEEGELRLPADPLTTAAEQQAGFP